MCCGEFRDNYNSLTHYAVSCAKLFSPTTDAEREREKEKEKERVMENPFTI